MNSTRKVSRKTKCRILATRVMCSSGTLSLLSNNFIDIISNFLLDYKLSLTKQASILASEAADENEEQNVEVDCSAGTRKSHRAARVMCSRGVLIFAI